MKKLLSLAVLLGGAGAALAAAKLISKRKAEQSRAEETDIYDAFCEANSQRHAEGISDEEYREKLNEIRSEAEAKGEDAISELLEEAYFLAEYKADAHAALIADVEETDATSLADFIRRFPDKAYTNGVLGLNEYNREGQAGESADYVAKCYYVELFKSESRLFEYVEMLGGDTAKITQEFDKIRENRI